MQGRPFIVDAHLDLAMNALHYGREQTLEVAEINRLERDAKLADDRCRGNAMVSLPEMRRGGVGIAFATLIARCRPGGSGIAAWTRRDLDYASPAAAHAAARGQLAYYESLERAGHVRLMRTGSDVTQHRAAWEADPAGTPIALVLLMEGADPITEPAELAAWHAWGLRLVGLAHVGESRYAGGTGANLPLSHAGRSLVDEMAELGVILDASHLCDASLDEALERFGGVIIASHSNCRSLVPGPRQIADGHVRRIVERDGVIGVVPYSVFLAAEAKAGDAITLAQVADHVDHICQLAGDAAHAGIGSDLDGGFGAEAVPRELRTIADLHRLADALADRGFDDAQIEGVMGGNWLRLLARAMPE